MNIAQLTAHVAVATGTSKRQAEAAVKAALAGIAKAVASEETVRLAEFGTFSVKQRAGRTGRNPRTGAKLAIPARKVVVFRAWKDLADALNK